jgi:ABC-type nitrate/sulfonate/bicarbonate transport system substrate-binding protein
MTAGAVVVAGAGYLGYQALTAPKLNVNLGIAPGTQTLWRYAAQQRTALFAPLGYDLTFSNYPDETALRSAFVSGEVDVIASLVPTVAALADAGIQAQLFLPIAWLREGYPFVVPTDSPIKGMNDLPGHRVATYPLDHPGMAYWLAMAPATAKVDLRSLKPTETLTPDVQLQQKLVDAAAMGGSQWAIMSRAAVYRKVTDLETAWQQISGSPRLLLFGGYLARRDWIAAHPQFIRDFITANQQAFASYKSDRAAFLNVTAAYPNGPRMTVADNQAQATYLGYDDVGADRMAISAQDIADYQKLFPLMADQQYLKSPPADAASLFYQAPPR